MDKPFQLDRKKFGIGKKHMSIKGKEKKNHTENKMTYMGPRIILPSL